MPTFNPKIKSIRDYSLSTCQHSETQGRNMAMNGIGIPGIAMQKNGVMAKGCQHNLNTSLFPIVSNSLQRNASDASLLHSSHEDEFIKEHSDGLSRVLNKSKLDTDPSLVPGNLRQSKKSASQLLEQFLIRDSSDSSNGINCGKVESLQDNTRNMNKPPKQNTVRQRGHESIYSTMQMFPAPKSFNLWPKPVKSTRSGSLCPCIDDSKSLNTGLPLCGKVKSELSINLVPYIQKSSISKDLYASSQSNSSVVKYRNCKKSANTFEQIDRRKTSQGNGHAKLRKVHSTERQPSMLSDGDNVVVCAKPTTSKPDHTACSRTVPILRDAKVQKSMGQIPKVELKATKKEKTQYEKNAQAKLIAKEEKYEQKRKQRREIYALNKVMTELENERFIQFMQNDGSIIAST